MNRVVLMLACLIGLTMTAFSQETTAVHGSMRSSGAPTVAGTDEGAAVVVLEFKWTKSRRTVDQPEVGPTGPAAAMTTADKNFQRNRRINDPAGVRDPNADTLDGRSAALEKSVQQSRAPKPKAVQGYDYRVKVQNASAKVVEVIFWEYQFKEAANPSALTRRQFLCGVKIKPGKDKELQAFGALGPSDVISVESLANKTAKPFEEQVVINRVEFADGSIWQRKDWNFGEMKASIARAVSTPWGTEMCRGL